MQTKDGRCVIYNGDIFEFNRSVDGKAGNWLLHLWCIHSVRLKVVLMPSWIVAQLLQLELTQGRSELEKCIDHKLTEKVFNHRYLKLMKTLLGEEARMMIETYNHDDATHNGWLRVQFSTLGCISILQDLLINLMLICYYLRLVSMIQWLNYFPFSFNSFIKYIFTEHIAIFKCCRWTLHVRNTAGEGQ